MDPYRHLNSKLDSDLIDLRDDVLRMSHLVEESILQATCALKDTDLELAQDIIRDDAFINKMRYHIEQKGYTMLATLQPTARDMRSVMTAIHITIELERIGDYAAGIAKLIFQLTETSMFAPLPEFYRMSQIGSEMLRSSVEAYLQWDQELAQQTYARDDEVDDLDAQATKKLIKTMKDKSKLIACATYMLWISHNYERIADRITNICERIVFMVTGDVIADIDSEL